MLPGVGWCVQASPLLPSHLPQGPVSQEVQCLCSPPVTQAAEARAPSTIYHSPPVCGGGWTCSSHGVAEFMEHVWERPEEVSDASVYAALTSLTSWLLWIMVSDAQSHSQHLSMWSMMASAPQQPEPFQLGVQSCSPCSVWAQQSMGDLLRAPGCSGENGVGAFCASVGKRRKCACLCPYCYCFNLTWGVIPYSLEM